MAAEPSPSVTSEDTTARAGAVGRPQPAYPPPRIAHPNPPLQTLPQPAYPPARTPYANAPAEILEEAPHRGHMTASQPHAHEPYLPHPRTGGADRDASRRAEEGASSRASHSHTPMTTPREGYTHTPISREGYGLSYGPRSQGGYPSAGATTGGLDPATATRPSVHSAGPGLSAQPDYYSRPLTGGSSTGRDAGAPPRGPDPTGRVPGGSLRGPDPPGRDQGRSPGGPETLQHTPREETGSVHSMTSEPEAWNSRASSPRSTVALPQAAAGNGHVQGNAID